MHRHWEESVRGMEEVERFDAVRDVGTVRDVRWGDIASESWERGVRREEPAVGRARELVRVVRNERRGGERGGDVEDARDYARGSGAIGRVRGGVFGVDEDIFQESTRTSEEREGEIEIGR